MADNTLTQPVTFISYSRRQLYFAESLALHLQKEGINVWFDLQQLQAGTVWSEGLKEGVSEAGLMVLVVSQASLESQYTQAEWKEFARKGNQLVLAICEPVVLPKELLKLPVYDFCRGFNSRLRHLAAFLKGTAEPRHDPVPSPNPFGISLKLPGAVWLVLTAHFASFIACMLGLLVAIALRPLDQVICHPFFWCWVAFSMVVGSLYAVPYLRHTLEYKKVKRGVWINLFLLIPAVFAVGQIGDVAFINDVPSEITGASHAYRSILGGAVILTLFVYIYLVRRAAGLLRWMQPEETLQNLRRRVHQPLVAKATFDVNAAEMREVKAVKYAIHADRADEPIVRWIEGIFKKAGHTRVASDGSPQHHIAILSNRSSEVWVQQTTKGYGGKLVFVVVSTIEFKENLAKTGDYQWVDARDGDKRDIIGLARSLGDAEAWKREVALEATPAMIDRWKVPNGIAMLKSIMGLFGIYLLVFSLTDLPGFIMELPNPFGQSEGGLIAWKPIIFLMVGAACLWISGRALVYRRVVGWVLYGFLLSSAILVGILGTVVRLRADDDVGVANAVQQVTPSLRQLWWFEPAILLSFILPVVLYCFLNSHFWLPASAKVNSDEVGIKASINRKFKIQNMLIVSFWVIVIFSLALWARFA